MGPNHIGGANNMDGMINIGGGDEHMVKLVKITGRTIARQHN
jgi:hypothetical protein